MGNKEARTWAHVGARYTFNYTPDFTIIILLYIYMYYVCTLVCLIMTCNIVAGEMIAGTNMAELSKKLPNLTRHYFTCSIIFTKNS